MNKHINKKATKLLEDYKKVQQRKSKETDRGCFEKCHHAYRLIFLNYFWYCGMFYKRKLFLPVKE
ncbi:Uncharacterised protein [Staphylococcus aureus]|uniref:Uncharacterized protein n=1 Tax=Staphylococcus aureus TaxID=1280 RepID=A0A380DRH3_STAAU|nr:Uncharacterised protein [Staphylococcus aureus]